MEKKFYIEVSGKKKIFVRSWEVKSPVAVVQVIHGMAEHSARYLKLADFLNKNKVSLYASDHRGHGKSIPGPAYKGLLDKNGLEIVTDDQVILNDLIKRKNQDVPIFILGHSMGSFLSQRLLEKNQNFKVSGLILSGSNGSFGLELVVGKFLAKFITFLKKDSPSPLLDFLTFLLYNKKTQKHSKYDWLCSDETVVSEYIKDPLCGGVLPASFYYSLFSLIRETLKGKNFQKIPNTLPVFIISGKEDPFGRYGKGAATLYKRYQSLGFEDLDMKLYENSRHEILNEKNKIEVYGDLLIWIKKHISA